MSTNTNTNYLESAKKQFAYYKMLGDKTFEQVSDENLFWRQHEDCNSIANVMNSAPSVETANIHQAMSVR